MDDVDSAAMAEAMGFSGFGMQTSNKRRKYNPAADAVIDPQVSSDAGIPMHNQSKSTGSGANTMPLGSRKPKNTDEIDLDDDDGDDPGPQYIETSYPPTASDVDHAQSQIDSILGGAAAVPFPQINQASHPPGITTHGSHEGQARSSFPANRGGGAGGRGRGHGRNRDEPGQEWWRDYYDPSSNVNPWERLEQSHNLSPRGAWMSWDEAKG